MIYLNVHGGLGNQIFQMLRCFVASKEYNVPIKINTYYLDKYQRAFAFEAHFINLTYEIEYRRSLRLPKVASKLLGKDTSLNFGKTILLDSYYQNLSSYNALSHIREFSQILLESLGNNVPCNHKSVLHVRTTDFNREEKAYIKELDTAINLSGKTTFDVITDDANKAALICKSLKNIQIKTINTFNNLTPQELLQKFGSFECIVSNGSTLSFWAALVYKRQYYTSNQTLSLNYSLMKSERFL